MTGSEPRAGRLVSTEGPLIPMPGGELRQPKRAMGFLDLVLFYVVTGISLRWIATAASAGPSAVVIWVGAWLAFYTPLALSVIELSSRYPQEGGLYIWSKRAFGDFAGFLCAWIYWTSNLPYFPAVLYFAFSNVLYMRGQRSAQLSNDARFYILFSLIALTVITLLNVIGLDIGKWLHNAGALAMWLPVMVVIVLGVVAWRRFGSATSFTAMTMTPSTHFKDIIFWSSLTFAFGGCETASFMGEEIRNARRTIPVALFTAGMVVTFCYVMGTVGVLLALPHNQVSDLEGLMQAITQTAARLGFFWIIPMAAALIAISNLGAAGAYLAAVARLPFVAGIDRFLPPVFGKLHSRWRTPYVALLVQAGCGVLFVFLGQAGTSVKGAYDVLVSLGIITYFIPYLFLFAAMFRLQREQAGPDVIRVPGGKPMALFLSCLGFTTALLTIVLSFVPSREESNSALAVVKVVGGTGILLAIGALLYWTGKRRFQKNAAHL
jgi:amino acid transporter